MPDPSPAPLVADQPVRPLADIFAMPQQADWQALAEKTLKGTAFDKLITRTLDGLSLQPLYAPASERVPVRAAPAEDLQRPWDLRMRVDHPDPSEANRIALNELENGAASLHLCLDPSGATGICALDQDQLSVVLEGVLLDLAPVSLEAGWYAPDAANALAVLAKGAPEARLGFDFDPLGLMLANGTAPGGYDLQLGRCLQTAMRHAAAYPKASLFAPSGVVVHEAGGTDGQELALAFASLLHYARTLIGDGMDPAEAFARQTLILSADTDYFAGLAKLRAARLLYAKLLVAHGLPAATPRIRVQSSRRMLSPLDPWSNLLRLSLSGFAAAVGGASTVMLDPFTQPLGLADDFARRLARNTQLILMEEAHLGRVADPAGGSGYLETFSLDLARAVWPRLQALSTDESLMAALESGVLQAEVDTARKAREGAIRTRRQGLIGVSEFADLHSRPVEVLSVDSADLAFTPAQTPITTPDTVVPPLIPTRLSAPFEALRAVAVALPAGSARVQTHTLGTPADFTARLMFARNLLAAGGLSSDDAPAPLAVLCSTDALYDEAGEAAVRALLSQGARTVWIAGHPKALGTDLSERLQQAGASGFIYMGMDIVSALETAHTLLSEVAA